MTSSAGAKTRSRAVRTDHNRLCRGTNRNLLPLAIPAAWRGRGAARGARWTGARLARAPATELRALELPEGGAARSANTLPWQVVPVRGGRFHPPLLLPLGCP